MQPLYCIGHFGTGNLGDDAIFSGMIACYAQYSVTQIYSFAPTYKRNVSYDEFIASEEYRNGILIIGGGGIPHCEWLLDRFQHAVDVASKRGMEVRIERIGLESCPAAIYPKLRRFIDSADSVSVRSEKSREILDSIGIPEVEVKPDFAYDLKPNTDTDTFFPAFNNDLPVIGLALASGFIELGAKIVRSLVGKFNVLFLPHCRHYIALQENDVITGETIWMKAQLHQSAKPGEMKCLPFPGTPEKLLGVYSKLSGVVGSRYHSFVFGQLSGIAVYCLSHGMKAQAWCDEHPDYPNSHDENNAPLLSRLIVDYLTTHLVNRE